MVGPNTEPMCEFLYFSLVVIAQDMMEYISHGRLFDDSTTCMIMISRDTPSWRAIFCFLEMLSTIDDLDLVCLGDY